MKVLLLAVVLLTVGCSAVDYAVMAKTAHDARRYDEVLAHAKEAVATSPTYAPGWYWLGVGHMEKAQWDDAIRAFHKALTLNPSPAQLQSAHLNLGKAYVEKREPDLAIPNLERAIALKPDDGFAHNSLGLAHGQKRHYALAINSLRRASELRPGDPVIHANLGRDYFRNGNYAQAVEALDRAVALGQTGLSGDVEVVRRALAERGPGPRFDPQSARATTPAHGYLGASLQALTAETSASTGVSDAKGALVGEVAAGGPAARAGLKAGDVILELNGTKVDEPTALVRAVTLTRPGETGRLVVWRDRKHQPITVTFGEWPGRTAAAPVAPAPSVEKPEAAATTASAGSGFLLRNSNLVLTNHHVIADRSRITVAFPNGETYTGRVVARDPGNDLALIEVQGRAPGPGLALAATTEIRPGEAVHAIGYPLSGGLSRQPSIVSGQVSSAVGMGDDIARFRTTAPINPGNSGGPIVNERGQVVGIAAAGLVRQGVEAIRFGIKAATASVIVQQSRAAQTAFDIAVTASPKAMATADIFAQTAPYVVLIETQ